MDLALAIKIVFTWAFGIGLVYKETFASVGWFYVWIGFIFMLTVIVIHDHHYAKVNNERL